MPAMVPPGRVLEDLLDSVAVVEEDKELDEDWIDNDVVVLELLACAAATSDVGSKVYVLSAGTADESEENVSMRNSSLTLAIVSCCVPKHMLICSAAAYQSCLPVLDEAGIRETH